MSTHNASKALIIAGGAAAMISLMPHCDVLGPLLGSIGGYLANVSPNLFSSAIEKDHAAADEAANYLHNEQVAGHVATVAGAVLDAFAKTSQPPVQAQLTALAAKLPEFWLQLHHAAAPGIAPLDGQEFIAHLAEVLTKAEAQPALPAEQWRPVLAAAARELPEKLRPSDAVLGYAAAYLARHLGEKLAVALTSPRDDTQRVFRKVLLRFLSQLLRDQQAIKTLLEQNPGLTATAVIDELEKRGLIRPEQPLKIILHQLPPRPDYFTGRTDDLAILRKADPATGAVLTGLRGMGGIGKTALALVLAHEWLPRFPDAQLKLDGAGTRTEPPPPSAADLLGQVINTFQPTAKLPDDLDALKAIYHDLLHGKRVLILLDNAADTAQAAPLIPPGGSALIVTTRHNIVLGKTAAHTVGRLPDDQAANLLREFHPVLGDADAAELVKLCAGLPLALRLAGAHLALDASERGGQPAVAAYLQALRSGRLATLDAEAQDANEVTISETLRLSVFPLPSAQRKAWRSLGVFTASFESAAAKAIAGADDAMLARFVRRSLLEREGANRYRLHDLAADYARAQHPEADLTALHLIHARYYAKVGDEAQDLYLKGDVVGGLGLFDCERAQIEAAFAWLVARRDAAAANMLVDLVDAVVYTGDLRFHPRQRIAWLEAQLAAAHTTGRHGHEGSALVNLGMAQAALCNEPEAIGFFEQALIVAHQLGDRSSEGAILANLGLAYGRLGNAVAAIKFHKRALVFARETRNRRVEASALGGFGNAYTAMGNDRKAIEFFVLQLAIIRKIPDRREEGNVLGSLGNGHLSLGDVQQAIGFYEQRLAIAREIGDRYSEGTALTGIGSAHLTLGRMRQAIDFCEQGLVIAREIGERREESNALLNIGCAHAELGDVYNAIEYHEKACVIAREIGDRRCEGNALSNLGIAYRRLGNARKAIEFHEQALDVMREIGERRAEGSILWNSALVFDELGDRAQAIARAEAALRIFEEIEDPNTAQVRVTLAEWRGE